MDTLQIDALATRVASLERENRRWRLGGVVALTVVVAMSVGAGKWGT